MNVYILGDSPTPRQRQRIQAQVQTALRSVPGWLFELLRARIDSLGIRNLPLIVELQDETHAQVLSLGMIESRPAARLLPRLVEGEVEWGQDPRYLVTKVVAYMAAPETSDTEFWDRWSAAVQADGLREDAMSSNPAWRDESDQGLLLEMAAAYIRKPQDKRWSKWPAVREFIDGWRSVPGGS